MAAYDDAVAELYQAPLAQFVAERKRLADALKTSGDKAGAKQLAGRGRPPISAWVVNQLWWHARDAFDDLLATAERLRQGDLKASAAHRDAIAKLRKRAASMLADAGHNANEATLRRVATTLSALAATGGFEPDPPGALSEDRDPPGFEALGIPNAPLAPAHAPKDELAEARARRAAAKREEDEEDEEDDHQARREEEAAKRAQEVAAKEREAAEKARIAAEKHRLEAALRTAKAELHEREREVRSLEKQLASAAAKVEDAQELVTDLERKLDDLRE